MYPHDRDEISRVLRRLWCSTSQSPISLLYSHCDYQYSRCVYYAYGTLTRGYGCLKSRLQIFLKHLIPLHCISRDTLLYIVFSLIFFFLVRSCYLCFNCVKIIEIKYIDRLQKHKKICAKLVNLNTKFSLA